MRPADESAPSPRTLVTILYVSAVVTLVVAIVLGAMVTPILFAIALFAIFDVFLARAYASGRLRLASDPHLGRPEQAGSVEGPGRGGAEDDAARAADRAAADPSYNPYAREN